VKTEFTYEESVDKVMSLADFERSRSAPQHSSFHLERMSLLLERFNNPNKKPSIHIAGTNGKGSVAAMLSAVLTRAGYLTGLYTSPHLHTVRERLRVNGEPVSESTFASLVSRTWPEVCNVSAEGSYGGITTFEIMTLLALIHFAEKAVNLQIIEVGLGGRLDATNLVNSEITIITPIGLDHVGTLGNTIRKIAREKAGIIKPKVPVIMAPQVPEAEAVIKEVADKHEAKLIDVAQECNWSGESVNHKKQKAKIKTKLDEYKFDLSLYGEHQLQNAATSIIALEQLSYKGYKVIDSHSALSSGFANIDWPGRMEEVELNGKRIILDGAHNKFAIDQLINSIPVSHYGRIILVFGALLGHSVYPMISRLTEICRGIVAVRSRHPKAFSSLEIAKSAEATGLKVLGKTETVDSGLNLALQMTNSEEIIVATGSISVVGEVRERVLGIPVERYPNIRIVEKPDI